MDLSTGFSNPFKDSLFSLLADEILVKILCDVDTFSVLNFCEEFKCYKFLKDRKIIRTVDLYRQFQLPTIGDIAKKITFEYVTTLNVNCLYWIPAAKLRAFIQKLKNLEILYAIQTNFSLSSSDLQTLSSLLKLTKLGISLKRTDELDVGSLSNIKIVYVHATDLKAVSGVHRSLSSIFPSLEKIWIEIEESGSSEIILQHLSFPDRIKINCQVNPPVPFINFDHFSATTYYSNRRYLQSYVTCSEKFTSEQQLIKTEPTLQNWKTLTQLRYCTPFSPKDARRLYLRENTLEDIFFEELNFCHTNSCIPRCRSAIVGILKTRSVHRLKRLSGMLCLFEAKNSQDDPNSYFTKKRVGVENSIESHPVEDIFKNFLGLTHLEIFICNQVSHQDAIQGYSLISLLEHLENLIVEVPVAVNGSFLIEVLKNCKNLQVLKVTSPGQNESLNYHISIAIPNATALKDFRYETFRIQVDKLLQQLCLMKSKTLERIVLICKNTDKFSHGPFTAFLDFNPQLVFLYFLLSGCTEVAGRNAQKTLNTYKKKHPSKVFFVKTTKVFHKAGFPMPDVHYYEMVCFKHDVATLRPLEHFQSF